MNGYTKGPWTLETVRTQSGICHKVGPFPERRDGDGPRHACLYADYPSSFNPADQELEANARLIAAAPDLMDALEGMIFGAGAVAVPHAGERQVLQMAVDHALKAIAKAKGEQP